LYISPVFAQQCERQQAGLMRLVIPPFAIHFGIRRKSAELGHAEKNIRLAGIPPKNKFSRPQMSEKFE